MTAPVNEMIERVAKALFLDDYEDGGSFWPDRVECAEHYRRHARLAIEALRVPTEAMNDAGYSASCEYDNGETVPSPEIAPATWRAMINEVLK